MKVSAIDLGFLYTKAIVNDKNIMMKSVVGNGKPLRFQDLSMGLRQGDHLQSKIGTENFFVSDLAIEQSDSVIHSLKGNRFDSSATEVLVKTAFALGYGNDFTETFIVSGLPVSHYNQYKESIEKLFLNKTHNYEVMDNNRLVRGSVKIGNGLFIPQPFGALLDKLLDDKGAIIDAKTASKTIAVIDPGFGTTDIYVVNSLSPVERLTFSTNTAMNHTYSLVGDKIEEKFGVSLPLYSIDKVMRTGTFTKHGTSYSMIEVIEWAKQSTANQLVAEVTNKWKSAHEIDEILLAGGGGLALSKYILPEFANIEVLPDTQRAVVNGYYKWGVRHHGKTV